MKEKQPILRTESSSYIIASFFNDENNKNKYGLFSVHNTLISPSKDSDLLYMDFTVLFDKEKCISAFDEHLKQKGFVRDDVDGFIGPKFEDRFLTNWVKYSKLDQKDLWVNSVGFKDDISGAWKDIAITNYPQGIILKETAMSMAFVKAYNKRTNLSELV